MEQLQNGRYRARAVDAVLGIADTGTKQVAVLFELLDMPGQSIPWYGYFTEKTEDRTLESLMHAGWHGDDLSNLMRDGLGESEVTLVVEQEQDQKTGEFRARVKWVNALGAGALVKNEMTDGDKLAFAQKMRAKVMQKRAKMMQRPAGNSGSPRNDVPPPGDNDVPWG